MQLGFNLPISGPNSAPRSLARLAQEGEAMGYDYLTLTDHVVLPDMSAPGYPYSESGEFIANAPTERHELLTATSFIAAKTSRIRLVLAVLVVPHRPAVLAAKMLSTIDVLSEGRLIIGIGAGWLKAEFDAVVTTPFAERGAVTDEYLHAFQALWTQERARFDGRYTKFADLVFLPRPVQQPHPPIWVGGESGPSMRRAARFGNAWYPIGSNNKHLLDTLPRLAAGIARLRRLTAEAGRDATDVSVVYRVKRYGHSVPPTASDGERRLFSGDDADIIADLHALRDLGVTAIDVEVEGHDEAATIGNMQRFKDTIFAQV
jgi:probable F420-dependent oxidoreductase